MISSNRVQAYDPSFGCSPPSTLFFAHYHPGDIALLLCRVTRGWRRSKPQLTCHSHSHTFADRFPHCHPYADAADHADGYANSHPASDRNTYIFTYTDRDGHPDRDPRANGDRNAAANSHRHIYSNPHRDARTYSYRHGHPDRYATGRARDIACHPDTHPNKGA
jgi:hypothetical protein